MAETSTPMDPSILLEDLYRQEEELRLELEDEDEEEDDDGDVVVRV